MRPLRGSRDLGHLAVARLDADGREHVDVVGIKRIEEPMSVV
jgi:hypothetical protein